LVEKAFQKLLLESIDSAFSSLGESAKQSIFFHLKSKFKIAREEIPCRLEDFDNGLEKIFGTGSRFLEVLIMKNLYERIGGEGKVLKWDEGKEFRFVDYVKTAQRNLTRYTKKK
jgi:hypothetical protein